MLRSVNVTIPSTADRVFVPLSDPVPDSTDATTASVLPRTRRPAESRTCRSGCVAKAAPSMAPLGCVTTKILRASWMIGRGEMTAGVRFTALNSSAVGP